MKRIPLVFAVAFISMHAFGQIEIKEEEESQEEKVKEIAIIPATERTTDFFVIANWSSTNRKLIENDGLFAQELGTRADEAKLNSWSFGLGIRDRVGKYFSWEGGLTYFRNGESYLFEGSDSTYSYETTYSYIGMPIKGFFTYGKNIRILAGGGIIPQMFMQYKQDREWVTPENTTVNESFKTKSGYNSFVLSAVANVGFQVLMGENMSILVMPEYRYQLTSSYEKTDGYKHFGRAFGVSMGLTYRL